MNWMAWMCQIRPVFERVFSFDWLTLDVEYFQNKNLLYSDFFYDLLVAEAFFCCSFSGYPHKEPQYSKED